MMRLNNYHRCGRSKCSKNHRFVPFWKCFVRIRSMMLGSTDSRKPIRKLAVKLFSKNSSLYDRKSPTLQTDGQTDRRTLYTIQRVHCAVKTAEPVIEILSVSDRPIIGSRALSFSDPYIHFACLSVRHSVCPQLRS